MAFTFEPAYVKASPDPAFTKMMDTYFKEQLVGEPKLIGLTGKARSGKDTVGSILAEQYGAQRLSFAEPIRNMLRALPLELSYEHFHGSLKEVELPVLGKSPRQMMQTLGTEWGRVCVNNDIWLKLAAVQLDAWKEAGLNAVITDVRFENEAHLIRQRGGIVWHIRREGIQDVAAHASEAGVAFHEGDVVINNNGSLSDLEGEVIGKFEQ